MQSKAIKVTRRTQVAPGIRLVCERHAGAMSAAVGVFVACGSRDEPSKLHGVTHLAEHLFFKGTSKNSAEEISALIERHGGEINAFTDRELTAFHAWVPVERTEMALELLFEMLFDSLFDAKEFERERLVVVQELRGYRDSPDEEFNDSLLEVAMKGHSLGRRIAGFEKGVAQLSRRQLIDFVMERFLRSEIVVSVVSPLKEEKVREIVRRALRKAEDWRWGHLVRERAKRFPKPAPHIPSTFQARSVVRRFDADQVQMAFMFPAVSLRSENEVVWSALANLLGGGSSSYLFREVREKRGLAYSTSAQLYSYSDVGLLGGYIATDSKRWLEAVTVAGETCRRLAAGVTQEDLDFIKSMMEGAIYMSYDGINNRMETLARQEFILHRTYTVREAVSDVRAITKQQLEKAAQVLTSKPCFFALGPVSQKDLPKVFKAWKG